MYMLTTHALIYVQDHSLRNQKDQGLQGQFGKLLIIYAKVHISLGIRLLIHENVMSFARSALMELMGDGYSIDRPRRASRRRCARGVTFSGFGLHVANRRG